MQRSFKTLFMIMLSVMTLAACGKSDSGTTTATSPIGQYINGVCYVNGVAQTYGTACPGATTTAGQIINGICYVNNVPQASILSCPQTGLTGINGISGIGTSGTEVCSGYYLYNGQLSYCSPTVRNCYGYTLQKVVGGTVVGTVLCQ